MVAFVSERWSNRIAWVDLEKWDAILLVEHKSVSKFMGFANSEDYLKNAGHRSAALEDSRLLPSTKIENHT
ncbi:hypothetical protein [Cyclobacterium plantarum]|uniref:hypothetical protein n=1 Tax=Cyclobacterium plantarum TaxID=2716263 RepID=UPI001FE948C5|nr:hypothetical protein [Cyclobacterium plantarum]